MAQLARYPTTYEHDLELLAKHDTKEAELTFNQRNAILMRSGEKKVRMTC